MSWYGIGAGLGRAIPNALNTYSAFQQLRAQQDQRDAERLAGQWALGGQDQGTGLFGNMASGLAQPAATGGIGGMPGYTQMPPQQQAPPYVPQASALDPGTGGTATGVMPLDDDPQTEQMARGTAASQGAPYLNPDVEMGGDAGPQMWTDPNSPSIQGPTGAGGDGQPAAGGAGAGVGAQPTAQDAGQGPAQGAGGNLMMQTPDGRSFNLGQLIHHVDPHQIAQQIQKVRPNADPAAVWRATSMIYKMSAGGSRYESMLAAQALKSIFPSANFVMGEQGRMHRAQMMSADRAAGRAAAGERQERSIGAAAERQQTGIAAVNARQERRISEQQAQRAIARADGQTKLRLSELHRQLGDLDRRVNQILNFGKPTGADKPELDRLIQQRGDVAKREKDMAEKVLGAGQ